MALAAVLVSAGISHAQKQRYLTMDGKELPTKDKRLWQWDGKTGAYKCRWEARDARGKVVNRQIVIYYPKAPASKTATDRSNYWVYWYNVDKKTIWGRCPTPRHPMYRQWKATLGADLWQVLPPKKRKPGVISPSKLGPLFKEEKVFSTTATKEPKSVPTDPKSAPITCIDFKNPVFI
jgi:hypothetical protein